MSGMKKDFNKDMPLHEYRTMLNDTCKHIERYCKSFSRDQQASYCNKMIKDTEPMADSLDYEDKKRAWSSFSSELRNYGTTGSMGKSACNDKECADETGRSQSNKSQSNKPGQMTGNTNGKSEKSASDQGKSSKSEFGNGNGKSGKFEQGNGKSGYPTNKSDSRDTMEPSSRPHKKG